jgi:hypothetical protein
MIASSNVDDEYRCLVMDVLSSIKGVCSHLNRPGAMRTDFEKGVVQWD